MREVRRKKWINALEIQNVLNEKIDVAVICSGHFVSGVPAKTNDTESVDWVPTRFLKLGRAIITVTFNCLFLITIITIDFFTACKIC